MLNCFLIEPTPMVRRWLRRYRADGAPCPTQPLHEARTWLEDKDDALRTLPSISGLSCRDEVPFKDSRWPRLCACGYAFRPQDEWQIFANQLWRPVGGNGHVYPLADAPPGAMYYADWTAGAYPCNTDHAVHRTGQPHLFIKCPDGKTWDADSIPANGGTWTRTGTPPNVTIRNSIDTGEYHGYLTDGVFGPGI